ncbi:hypothetical protein DFH08DRAFT_695269 [Mycena albidolilacea]|uniref:CxC5 like cysteine cluster associated with KDZ domain-containing protein n=1 Tax=Mycena albidolilacea TaxID=1033008 RepID=A0AAD7A812_9AGAR|nr:hypothetical protein DFH08DRAFT_695269 [Mycena albidolilacea]
MSVFSAVRRDPDLRHLSLTHLMTFTRLLSVLKNDIILCQPNYITALDVPPPSLPPVIHLFVSNAADIPSDTVSKLWEFLKDDVWFLCDTRLSAEEEELFRVYGWKAGLTSLTLYPPTHHCANPDCAEFGKPMKKDESRQVVVYTQGNGAVPAWAIHLYCCGCSTNYHHNFSVHNDMQTYYGDKPNYLQIGEHQFAERKLVGMWVMMMLVAWVSATNCSRVYNMALSEQQERDFAAGGWQFGCVLTPDHVWDAFVVLTLLDYNDRKNTYLQVPHTGEQKNRFKDAMRARNREVVEAGQDEIAHCCNKCMRAWTRPDGTEYDVQAVISDRNAMGHRRCHKSPCTGELDSNRHRFCPTHAYLAGFCAIVGCEAPVVSGKKACLAHAEVERLHYERGRAAFTLRDRLRKHRLAHPSNQAPVIEGSMGEGDAGEGEGDEDEGEQWFDQDDSGHIHLRPAEHPGSIGVDDSTPCEAAKSDTGNRKFKVLFGGLRTHNEQILVHPCGIIVLCATFYNAEAVSNVLLHVQKTFSVPHAFKPEHFIYDTNCDAKQQVMAHPDVWWWFHDVGMTVDVFHFLHKHKATHTFCQENNNPADYPELMGPDGNTWFFNTSIAEQTNVWLGGYQSICREMLPVKYNFFLDEMIRLHNQTIVANLAAAGHEPRERVAHST